MSIFFVATREKLLVVGLSCLSLLASLSSVVVTFVVVKFSVVSQMQALSFQVHLCLSFLHLLVQIQFF